MWIALAAVLVLMGLLIAPLRDSEFESDEAAVPAVATRAEQKPRGAEPPVRAVGETRRTATPRKTAPPAPGMFRPATRRGRDATPRAEEDVPAEVLIETLRAGGEHGGVAAFPLPGHRPPRSGVIVPEDYVLPEGYARHYQTTDDGQRLEAILVVAPGYELVDPAGELVDLMDGYIVPADLAPPDLPVEMLEVPDRQPPPTE